MGEQPIREEEMQAWIDGRLPPERAAMFERWRQANPVEAARAHQDRELRRELQARLASRMTGPVPSHLRVAGILARKRRAARRMAWSAAATVALVLAGAAGGWLAHDAAPFRAAGGASGTMAAGSGLTADALAAHRMYVVEPRHPVEVGVAEEEHLVRWLSNRLKRPLKAPNLGARGFQLMGGRLLPGSPSGPAAQLMYTNPEGVRLTVYIRPTGDEGTTEFRFASSGEVNAFWWMDRGFGYAISAPVGREALLPIAQAVFDELDGVSR